MCLQSVQEPLEGVINYFKKTVAHRIEADAYHIKLYMYI